MLAFIAEQVVEARVCVGDHETAASRSDCAARCKQREEEQERGVAHHDE
jgi:hypothetical protein